MEAKKVIFGSVNTLLSRIGDEENYQRRETYRLSSGQVYTKIDISLALGY